MSLVVVGSVGIDHVETPFGEVDDAVGGSAVYFSLAASVFTDVSLAANVGNDYPSEVWQALEGRGADLSGLRHFEDQPSFRWSGRYEGDMNEAQTLRTDLNVLAEPPVIPAAYRGADLAFLANMGPDVQARCLDELAPKRVFADTMNLWIDTQRAELLALLQRLDGLVLNDGEARMLTGEHNLIRAGAALLAMGPGMVVIKKGEHGAFLFDDRFHFALPAYPTDKVVDPTGAGDSFAGGFLGSLAEMGEPNPENLRRAMAYGVVTASLTVESFSTGGLEGSIRPDLDRRFAELQEFVRIS